MITIHTHMITIHTHMYLKGVPSQLNHHKEGIESFCPITDEPMHGLT